MVSSAPSYLYKETQVDLESSCTDSTTVLIRLPLHGNSWTSRTVPKRPLPHDVPRAEDERSYRQRHLASAASIYHRKHHKSPRSFLWRILEDGKVLAIRAVDLAKQKKGPDAYLTLRLYIPNAIRPHCIVLTDSAEHDTLTVFALTDNNHLYTITLRPDFFSKRASAEENVVEWCKAYSPTGFSSKHAHRMIALSSSEVVISLHDGGFLQLRQKVEDGSAWEEAHYNEGGWGLRSLISFQSNNTFLYGKVYMELAAITSMESTSIDGLDCIVSVSLDHRVRVWSLEERKVLYNEDLLFEDVSSQEYAKRMIQPTYSNLVRTMSRDTGTIIVTFSPHGAGQFNFRNACKQDDGQVLVRDIFSGDRLEPVPPTSDVWTLADFCIVSEKGDPNKMTLWILWKNNLVHRTQRVELDIDEDTIQHPWTGRSVKSAWTQPWATAAAETLQDKPMPINNNQDPDDAVGKWLNHILYPGRFTTATIDTALSLYEKLGDNQANPARPSQNLAEQICSLIGSAAHLERGAHGLSYDVFNTAIDAQWRRFYRLLIELDKQRREALSLSYDNEFEIATVVTADTLITIRDCSQIERLWHAPECPISDKSASMLIHAAAMLTESLSEETLHTCRQLVFADIFQESHLPDSQRLQAFYDSSNLGAQISDEDYDQLLHNLGGSFSDVTNDAYDSLIEALLSPEELDARLETLGLAEFGMKTIVRGVQETTCLQETICFDQLVLLAFIDAEVNQEEEKMSLDITAIYTRIRPVLMKSRFLSELCKLQITVPSNRPASRNGTPEKVTTPSQPQPMQVISVLSASLSRLLGLITHSGAPTSALLTDLIGRVCHPESEYEVQPATVQCFLLVQGRPDLADALAMFCEQDALSIYVQGRICVARKDFAGALSCFRRAAYDLGQINLPKVERARWGGLLDGNERALLHSGLPLYYMHIATIFDAGKAPSFVVASARLGLQFCRVRGQVVATDSTKADLQSILFRAALQSCQFEVAYTTLSLLSDLAVRQSSVRQLVNRMCEMSAATRLLDFAFIGLQDSVDAALLQKCDAIADVNNGVPYHDILYSWRVRHNDFRGAAAVSLDRLLKLQKTTSTSKSATLPDASTNRVVSSQDRLETPLTRQYLALINALSCVEPKQAWVLCEGNLGKQKSGRGRDGMVVGSKRRVVTLEDVRREYAAELDRIAALDNGQFAFGDGSGDEDEDVGGADDEDGDVNML